MSLDLARVERLLDDAIGPIGADDPKGRKRLRILRAATELFAKQGYRKTNVGEIAELAGVAKGTVYLYFETKAQIMWSAVALEKKEHLHRFRHVLDPRASARERLRRLVHHVLTTATQMPLISRLVGDSSEMAALYAEIPSALLEQTEELRHEWLDELVDSAAGGSLDPAEVRERTQVFVGIGALAHRLLDKQVVGDMTPSRFAKVIADMLVDGLVPRRRSSKASAKKQKGDDR